MMKEKLKPYLQALPDVFSYQIVTKALLAIWLFLFGRLFQALLRSSGRVAVTSGDWQFLFTTWQGILILLVGLLSLFIYVAFDLNTKIVICRNIVTGRSMPMIDTLKEGLMSIRRLFSLQGILIVLYIALVAPILGIGVSITATEGLYIPTFISSFIKDSVLYSLLAGAAVLLLLAIGVANLFIMHGLIIDGLDVSEASKQSEKLIRSNLKDYIKQNVLTIMTAACLIAGTAVVCLFVPLWIIEMIPLPLVISRLLTIILATFGVIVSVLADLLALPLYLMKMTQLFYSYKQGSVYEYREISAKKRRYNARWLSCVAAVIVICIALMYVNFDLLLPSGTYVKVIAHRAGGSEAAENTISGIDAAVRAGAYGSEIDIQRTKDGSYVINHDGTFKRVAGDGRKPEEMTLDEVKKLRVDGEPVPEFEEMLGASKGRLVLFIELKGSTADRKMADDAVKLVTQHWMKDECVLISLKYDLIDYIEKTYPEIQTGFLTFASFGKTAELNCDYIGLEEESATFDTISNIHAEKKKALVWTANEEGSQRHFLCTEADGIITDNVSQALLLSKKLEYRSDIDRMVDKIKTIL